MGSPAVVHATEIARIHGLLNQQVNLAIDRERRAFLDALQLLAEPQQRPLGRFVDVALRLICTPTAHVDVQPFQPIGEVISINKKLEIFGF